MSAEIDVGTLPRLSIHEIAAYERLVTAKQRLLDAMLCDVEAVRQEKSKTAAAIAECLSEFRAALQGAGAGNALERLENTVVQSEMVARNLLSLNLDDALAKQTGCTLGELVGYTVGPFACPDADQWCRVRHWVASFADAVISRVNPNEAATTAPAVAWSGPANEVRNRISADQHEGPTIDVDTLDLTSFIAKAQALAKAIHDVSDIGFTLPDAFDRTNTAAKTAKEEVQQEMRVLGLMEISEDGKPDRDQLKGKLVGNDHKVAAVSLIISDVWNFQPFAPYSQSCPKLDRALTMLPQEEQQGYSMVLRPLLPRVLNQIDELTDNDKSRLLRILNDLSTAIDEAHHINVSTDEDNRVAASDIKKWSETAKELESLLAQMAALIKVPPVLQTIRADGPNGNGIGLHRDRETWITAASMRNAFARAVVDQLRREVEKRREENSIRLVGDVWELRFGRELGQFPAKGYKCIPWICTILSRPNRTLTVAEVRGDPEGLLAADALLGAELETTAESASNIRERLVKLDKELKDVDEMAADLGWSETLTAKKVALKEEQGCLVSQIRQTANNGKSGRSPLRKRFRTPLERSHHNMATQIRTFIRDELTTAMPRLAEHLSTWLALEKPSFRYCPPSGTTSWKI
jgi:hypothetical protein